MGHTCATCVVSLLVSALLSPPVRSQTDVVAFAGVRLNSAWNAERFTQVSTGENHSVALRPDGSIEIWGRGLGVVTEAPRAAEGVRFVQVAAGRGHSLALGSDGSVVAWGDDSHGQCQVPQLRPGRRYVGVTAGRYHSLALVDDGSLLAFGRNHETQCNVPPLPDGVGYVQAAAVDHHAIALRTDGQAVSWGEPLHDAHEIPPASPDNPYVQVATGYHKNLLLRADGTVIGTGYDYHGEASIPDPPEGTSYVQVRVGRWFSLTLRSDGAVRIWGLLMHLGHAIQEPELPVGRRVVGMTACDDHALLVLDNGAFLALGFSHQWEACNVPPQPVGVDYVTLKLEDEYGYAGALLSDGSIQMWGGGDFVSMRAPGLPADVRYTDFELNASLAIALRDDGTIVAWGSDSFWNTEIPDLPPGVGFTDIALCDGAAFAVASDGSLVAWGPNAGFSSLLDVPALPPGTFYLAVSAAGIKAQALRSDGTVVAWGLDAFGYEYPAPAPPAGQTFVDVDAGEWAHVARTSEGEVSVWGTGCQGPCEAPFPPTGTRLIDAEAGYGGVFGVLDDGSLVRLELPLYETWRRVDSPAKTRHLTVHASNDQASSTVESSPCAGSVRVSCSQDNSSRGGTQRAQFQVLGCPDHERTSLMFSVGGLPPRSVGYFVGGDGSERTRLAPAGLCITGAMQRMSELLVAGADGQVVHGVDVNAAPFGVPGTEVLPGSTRTFQYLYRDASQVWQVQSTNAVEVRFAP